MHARSVVAVTTVFPPPPLVLWPVAGANILITNTGIVKLADFGCSKAMDTMTTPTATLMDASYKRIKGTVPFMAPEGGSASLLLAGGCCPAPFSSPPYPTPPHPQGLQIGGVEWCSVLSLRARSCLCFQCRSVVCVCRGRRVDFVRGGACMVSCMCMLHVRLRKSGAETLACSSCCACCVVVPWQYCAKSVTDARPTSGALVVWSLKWPLVACPGPSFPTR